jgi:hypothetical protein
MWHRIVGSAVEHAAQCAAALDPDIDLVPDEPKLDFQTLFLDQEADDEDATSLAEALNALARIMTKEFKASDVAEKINLTTAKTDLSSTESELAALAVRAFLFPSQPLSAQVTAKAVGRRLKAHVGEPVKRGAETLMLKVSMDTHDKVQKFYVTII